MGQRGYSEDSRPDLKQIVVEAALDEQGRPVCCELLAGNATDVKLFLPVIRAMKGESYYLRTELRGSCFDVLNTAGVAIPPTLHR